MVNGKDALKWTFQWTPPSPDDIGGASLPTEIMEITTVPETGFSFEQRCRDLECLFGDPELALVCACCASGDSNRSCESCRHATAWHRCQRSHTRLVWKAGTLYAGRLDVQRVLFNLHRRRLPMHVLEQKADEYVEKYPDLVTKDEAKKMLSQRRIRSKLIIP